LLKFLEISLISCRIKILPPTLPIYLADFKSFKFLGWHSIFERE